ncbi:MAG: sigma 54-interacting transcriptional regulator, partial [Longimicrobiales bacterium]
LLESEFFGHAEGAFTGASSARRGLFLESEGGTILLDEIAEMPVELQPKLLRVLEEGRVRPVGSDQDLPVDVRIVAATNRDLDRAMEEKSFRKDLYYRLETFQLHVPPLRERGDDIGRLALHFLRKIAAGTESKVESISTSALDRLRAYAFPGNVRELENAIERAVTYCDGSEIRPEHLPERIRAAAAGSTPRSGKAPGLGGSTSDAEGSRIRLLEDGELPPLDEVERRYIVHVLDRLEGNKRRAADTLGIGRRTLYRRLEAYGGDGGDGKESD